VEGERESYDDAGDRPQAGFKGREHRHFESHRDSPYHVGGIRNGARSGNLRVLA
jgi:hypothetical protein